MDKKISFLGDSITLGYGLEDKADRFSTILCKRLGLSEQNFGIIGTLMAPAGLSKDDGTSFLSRISLTRDADYVVIFGGTNDYFWSDSPISPEDGNADDPKYFSVAVKQIFEYCISHHNKSNILIVTPYPHHGIGNFKGGSSFKDSSEHDTTEMNYNSCTLKDYVDILVKTANEYRIPVLDLHTKSAFDWKVHTSDGCHPNEAGHLWLADQIEKNILI